MDVLGPLEVLRDATRAGMNIAARLVTRQRQTEIRGAFGLRFAPDETFEAGKADILLVPGGGWASRASVGAWAEYKRGDWLPLLAAAASTARIMAGVCTGTMLLAHAGIVGKRRATTHRAAWADLAATGATLVEDRVVDDDALMTSGGVTSGIDLALWLVERECSPEIAERIATRMEYTRFRPAPRLN
jgi:transcriptional regulator GlxA family with amidase domain